MTAYAFWNNKGGVGKSYLSFVAACEYAHKHPSTLVFVIDLCPQANASEILLGADELSEKYLKLFRPTLRKTIGGYIEQRLHSPFSMIKNIDQFIIIPNQFNSHIPNNLRLIAGDYLLEVVSEAMRQAAQLAVPLDAWKQVLSWVRDLVVRIRADHQFDETFFIIDCNPSFSIYTQMALVASDRLVLPFTADDSSRRAIENVFALVYGLGEEKLSSYAKISFAKKAIDAGVNPPTIHTLINNRVTLYEGRPSKAFRAASRRVKDTVDAIYAKHKAPFHFTNEKPSDGFVEVPDYHSAAIVSSLTGTPLHQLKPGPKDLRGERIQLNKEPLERYRESLNRFVDRL